MEKQKNRRIEKYKNTKITKQKNRKWESKSLFHGTIKKQNKKENKIKRRKGKKNQK